MTFQELGQRYQNKSPDDSLLPSSTQQIVRDENTLFHYIGAFTLFGLIHMAILWKQKQ